MEFNDLPLELMLYVFSWFNLKELISVSVVCKLWYKLTQDPTLYTQITLTGNDRITTEQARRFITGKVCVRELSLRHRPDAAEILEHIAENCPQLQTVTVLRSQTTATSVESLVSKCGLIRNLYLDFHSRKNLNVTCFSTLKNLRELNLSRHWIGEPSEVLEVTTKCEFLEELNLCYIEFSGEGGSNSRLDDLVSSAISSRKDTLKKLALGGRYISDRTLYQIGTSCDKLVMFCLRNTVIISDTGLLPVFFMHNLVWLELHSVRNISPAAWKNLWERSNLTKLRHLSLSFIKIDDLSLSIIGQKCPLLSYLNVAFCGLSVSDEGFELLMRNCSKLKFLTIEYFENITGACLVSLPEKLPHLMLLDVSDCPGIESSLLTDLENRMPDLAVRRYDHVLKRNTNNTRYEQVQTMPEMKVNMPLRSAKLIYRISE